MGESPVLLRFALLAFSSVLIIVNPFSTAPLFITMTEGDPLAKRHRTAWRAKPRHDLLALPRFW